MFRRAKVAKWFRNNLVGSCITTLVLAASAAAQSDESLYYLTFDRNKIPVVVDRVTRQAEAVAEWVDTTKPPPNCEQAKWFASKDFGQLFGCESGERYEAFEVYDSAYPRGTKFLKPHPFDPLPQPRPQPPKPKDDGDDTMYPGPVIDR